MIKKIKISNFKSLMSFELELAKFNCLIGLNGSGKSTVLQAFDFLSQLMLGKLDDWLYTRNWAVREIKFRLPEKQGITTSFRVELEDSQGKSIIWNGDFSQNLQRCQSERVIYSSAEREEEILSVDKGSWCVGGPRQKNHI